MKEIVAIVFMLFCYPVVCANISPQSEKFYEEIQAMRDKADQFISKQANFDELRKAENILLDAFSFATSDKVKAFYAENKYLKARQWDILRDLIQVNIYQHDKKMVAKYAMELINNDSLSWIRDSSDIDKLLADNKTYQAHIKKTEAWKRIGSKESFTSGFKNNLFDAEKIAGLANFWLEAKNNFVYFDQVPKLDWDKAFKEYIPKVLATKNTKDYYKKLMQFSALLGDSHTGVYPPKELSNRFYAKPPMRTELIEGKVIVTQIYSEKLSKLGLSIGDEIIKINAQDVFVYANKKIKPYVGSSTVQDLNVRLFNYMLLRGEEDKPVTLLIKNKKTLIVPRTGYQDVIYPEKNQFKLSPEGIAIIALDSFASSESYDVFLKHLPDIINSKALIIDVRNNGGGSSSWGYKVLGHLTDKALVTSASKTRKYIATERAWGDEQIKWHSYDNTPVSYDFTEIYNKKVVVLAGAKTFSAAEDFVLAFKVNKLGLVIGGKTAGSSGQPLVFSLPGGGKARVCSKRDMYPDGSDWVGYGIPADIKVAKTYEDVINHTDSVLEFALNYLRK